MKIHLPLDFRLSSGDIFRSSIIFVAIIASLVFASVRAVAVDNGGTYEAYQIGQTNQIFMREVGKVDNSKTVYCVNLKREIPPAEERLNPDTGKKEFPKFTKTDPVNDFAKFTEQFGRHKPDLSSKLLFALWNGYPNDAMGIMSAKVISAMDFTTATQHAVWHITDGYDSPLKNGNSIQSQIYRVLIGEGNLVETALVKTQPQEVPAALKLSIYEPTNNIVSQKELGWQNLISTEFFDDNGKIVAPEPPKHGEGETGDFFNFSFEKIDMENNSPVSGAKLRLQDQNQKNGIKVESTAGPMNEFRWNSGSHAEKISLKAGEYLLYEDTAPREYLLPKLQQKHMPINQIKVNDEGTVSLGDPSSIYVRVDKNNVKVLNERDMGVPKPGSSEKKIRISKFAEDDNGKELPDAELAVYKGDYSQGIPDSTEAINMWKTGSAKDLSFGEGTYTLVEKSAPQGYEKASNIVFKVEKDKVFLKNGENWSEIKKFVPEDPKPLKAYSDFKDENQSWSGTPFGKFYYIDRDDKNESANTDEIIYCFNIHRRAPLESSDYGANYETWETAPTFKAQYDAETLIKYAEKPRIEDPKKFGDAIQRVIYAGHPRNYKKFGEGLTPTAFRTITQMAIYNFTDSFGLKELEEIAKVNPNSNDAHGFAGILRPENAEIKKAYENLVAYAAGDEPVPADMRTPLYVTSDNKFQNFVGTWTDPQRVLPVIEMIDRKAPSKPSGHEVLISKVDLGGKDVVGAKLRILKVDAESSTVPKVATDLQDNTSAEWETVADAAHKVKLAAGKYKLEETFAPAPLKVITTFEFEVDDRGDVRLGKVATAGERDGKAVLEALVSGEDNNNVITVVDGIDDSKVAQNVKVSKVDLGGVEVDGAKLQVLEVGSDSVVQDVMTQKPAEWETSKGEKVHEVSLLPGSYRLKESFAPQDLRPITTFEFSVDAQGVVTVKDVAVAGRNAAGHEMKEAVVNDQGVVVVTDGAQEPEKPTVTLNTNAYDANASRWDNTLDSTGGTIADVISYEGLVPGKQYRVKGELMDKTTKKSLGVVKIDTFKPEAANGEHIMKFDVGASLAGKSIVVFETIYEDNDEEINEDTPYVVRHADIDSASQTIVVDSAYTPKRISTQAYNKDDVNKGKTIPAEGGTVVDVVTYEGLKTGNTYTISGELMDKETQNGTGITSQKTFIAEDTNGEVELEFIVGPGFAGKDLVVFETLTDDGGFEVATHKDIESASQTVSVASLKESSGWEIWAAGAVIGAGIIGLFSGNGSSTPHTGSSNVHPSPKPSTQPSVAPTSVPPNADKSQEKAGKGSNMLAKTGASILGLLIAAILFTLAGFGLVSWRRKN